MRFYRMATRYELWSSIDHSVVFLMKMTALVVGGALQSKYTMEAHVPKGGLDLSRARILRRDYLQRCRFKGLSLQSMTAAWSI